MESISTSFIIESSKILSYYQLQLERAEKALEWMNRTDQDDDYVVCGIGWKAQQESARDAKKAIRSLTEKGYCIDYNKMEEYSECFYNYETQKEIFIRKGKYGEFSIINGNCYSSKKLLKMGFLKSALFPKIYLDGSQEMVYKCI